MIRSGREEKKKRHNFKGKNKEIVLYTGEDSKPTYKGISWEACYPLKILKSSSHYCLLMAMLAGIAANYSSATFETLRQFPV